MTLDCYDPIIWLGAEDPTDSYSHVVFSFMNRLISLILVVFISLWVIILRVFYPRKISTMIKASVFSIFDDLKSPGSATSSNCDSPINPTPLDGFEAINYEHVSSTSLPSFELQELSIQNREIARAFQSNPQPPQKMIFICDFEDCCCDCLCQSWKSLYETKIKAFFNKLSNRTADYLKTHLKKLCFYMLMIGTFIYNPLRSFFSFIFNPCNLEEKFAPDILLVFFNCLDFFCGFLVFTLYVFLISFLNTEAEFMKIYLFDKSYRARLMYFHLKKALMLGFCHFAFKLAYKSAEFLFNSPFDQTIGNGFKNAFYDLWLLFKSLFLLMSMRKNMNSPIDQDCGNLRAHAQYFAIQRHIIHCLPTSINVYAIIKKLARNDLKIEVLDARLDKFFRRAGQNLEEELQIIERQNFKNVLRNKGILRYAPKLFKYGLFIICMLNIIIMVALILMIQTIQDQTNKDSKVGIYNWADKAYSIIWLFECSIMPFLIYSSLKREAYLPKRMSHFEERMKEMNSSN